MDKLTTQTGRPPLYQQVKEYIIDKINDSALLPGMKIESEAELVAGLNVSRMTVNRALRELTAEGRIKRIQGRGTFVADRKPQAALLQISSIAEEIRARGGSYSCTVHLLQEEKAKPSVALAMQLQPYAPVFHSIIVHKDHKVPIQLGCRYINPRIAPAYLNQDFSRITVSDYLLSIAAVTAVEHIVEALIPDPWIRDLLEINAAEPCLALHRKTWVGELVATSSTFYSPGSRYTLGGKFTPTASGSIDIA
ncbi:histidine utilization repressor [Desulfopila sp. IMCC35006]|uniref:histidine utilization repressor n=1 Tax=Desulfopila sp. IMCC35006 TaxID=2569542 RepID=UPI0010ABFADF|nr:histidine utilization repressor [Desulfopila sp. IMCC35006]TKB27142.1 histidine utilization repressor [Desulfopila sp. IMCC35006]